MKSFIKLGKYFLILLLITSCEKLIKTEKKIIESENQPSKSSIKEKNKMEIRISCGEGDISEFLKEGWIIVKESKVEKVCTWKSYPSNKKCDMEKDKGCKITKPDKIGEEAIYLLEK